MRQPLHTSIYRVKRFAAQVAALVLCVAVVSAMFPVSVAQAAFNPKINYQGKLLNASSVAVADGTYHMQFKLYTTDTGGSPIWTEDRSTAAGDRVVVTNGLFSVMLGSSTPLTDVNFNQTLYLGVEIGGSSGSPSWDGEMTPRKVLGAVPAAFEADRLDHLSSEEFLRSDAVNATSTATTFLTVTQNGAGNIASFVGPSSAAVLDILSGGKIGIATTTPNNKLDIFSSTKAAIGFSGASGSNYKWTIGMDVSNGGRFSIASSTALGTTDRFVIDGAGNVGIGTTTPGTLLSLGDTGANTVNISATATSTFGSGINLRTGCFAVNGTCISSGAGSSQWTTNGSTIYYNTGNVGIGTTSPYAALSVVGQAVAAYFTATTSTASVFPYASTTALTVSGTLGLTLGSLNGPLQANNGAVSATTSIGVLYGGTGLTAAPSYGNLLVGNASGGYTLTATSSLKIALSDTTGILSVTKGGTGVSTFGGANTLLYTTAADTLSSITTGNSSILVTDSSGVPSWSTTLPAYTLGGAITGNSQTITGLSQITVTGTAASSTFSTGGLTVGTNQFLVQQTSGRVGIGTTSPSAQLGIVGANATGAAPKALYVVGGTGTSVGGAIFIKAGNGTANNAADGGAIDITAGNASSNGILSSSGGGGTVTITSGDGGSVCDAGCLPAGNIVLRGGTNYNGSGGIIQMRGGGSDITQWLNVSGTKVGYVDSSGNVTLGTFTASSTSAASVFPYASTTALTVSGTLGLTLGSLNGPLQANNGAVSATTSIGVLYGGTGLTAAPSYGNLLVGNASGGYTLTATSSLKIALSDTTGILSVAKGGTGVSTFGGANTLLYTTAADTLSSITTGNSSILVTDSSGVPSWSTTLPAYTLGGNVTGNSKSITGLSQLSVGTTTPNNLADFYSTTKAAIGFSGASGSNYKWTIGMDVSNGGRFSIASSTALGTTDRFVIDGAGNVGIGTSSPIAKLSVNGVAGDTNQYLFVVASSTAAFATTTHFSVSATGTVSFTNGEYIHNATNGNLSFGATGNAVDNCALNADLGSSWQYGVSLSVTGDVDCANIRFLNALTLQNATPLYLSSSASAGFVNSTSGGSNNYVLDIGTYVNGINNQSGIIRIGQRGNFATNNSTNAATSTVREPRLRLMPASAGTGTYLDLYSDNTNNQIDWKAGNLVFATTTIGAVKNIILGTSTTWTRVGVGTTSPWRSFSVNGTVGFAGLTSTSTPGTSLCLSNMFEVTTRSSAIGCGTAASSLRFKENVNPLTEAGSLAEIMALRPVSFNYKTSWLGALASDPNWTAEYVGFIAEDVQQIDSRLVAVDELGLPAAVHYGNITSLLTKAVQGINKTFTVGNISAHATSTILSLYEGTAAPALTISANGNVSIGSGGVAVDSKLNVVGGVRATGFAVVSDRASLRDIVRLGDTEYQSYTDKIRAVSVSTYRYETDATGVVRIGIVADEAPSEILTASGDVDIYKLAVFTLGGVKAQQVKIDALSDRVTAIEQRLASGTFTTGTSTPATSIDTILSALEQLGTRITQGVAAVKALFADTITLGSPEKPSGITLYDEVSGQPYCLKVAGGITIAAAGACQVREIVPINPITPPVVPPVTPPVTPPVEPPSNGTSTPPTVTPPDTTTPPEIPPAGDNAPAPDAPPAPEPAPAPATVPPPPPPTDAPAA